MPDELLGRARAAELNVSRLAAAAVAEELDRRARIAALDAYLSELDAETGPPSEDDVVAAREWVDQIVRRVSTADPHPGAA